MNKVQDTFSRDKRSIDRLSRVGEEDILRENEEVPEIEALIPKQQTSIISKSYQITPTAREILTKGASA